MFLCPGSRDINFADKELSWFPKSGYESLVNSYKGMFSLEESQLHDSRLESCATSTRKQGLFKKKLVTRQHDRFNLTIWQKLINR